MRKKSLEKINTENIKGVILDLDDTLYSYEKCHIYALEQTFLKYLTISKKKLAQNSFEKRYRESRNKITERLKNTGSCRSRLLAFQMLLEKEKNESAPKNSLILENCYWKSFISKMTPDKEIKEFLKKLKKQNIKTCILSDMTMEIQVRKLQKLGMSNLFDYMVTSEEVGKEKPELLNFNTALKKLDLRNGEVMMIGDSLSKDGFGAKKANIKFHYYRAKA